MKKLNYYFIVAIALFTPWLECARVALCVVATGKYAPFAQEMIASARTFFCTEHDVHYFVFTDGAIEDSPDVTQVFQKRLGWPYDTLMRFDIYLKNEHLFTDFDYIFATDADMRFVAPVTGKILSDRVATQHPGQDPHYTHRRGTYETNPRSTACVKNSEGTHYFAGGFYGGSKTEFFNMMRAVTKNVALDLEQNFIAIWHDESHLNRLFIDMPPTKILSPAYCCPENTPAMWYPEEIRKLKKRLIALDKNHDQLRK